MFTGLIQGLGRVAAFSGQRLVVDSSGVWGTSEPLHAGESVAVNGVCLTTVTAGELVFDLSEETLQRTALADLAPGHPVNLERAMRPVDRFGGHFVQGHVDGLAAVMGLEELLGAWRLEVKVPPGGGRYLIDKGSVTLDGISLTVVEPRGDEFHVVVIPHTWAQTNLHTRRAGDSLHVEYDVLAKHVEKLLASRVVVE